MKDGLWRVGVKPDKVSTDINGRVLANYRSAYSFGYTAASDVIKGRIDNAVFKGKIVLVASCHIRPEGSRSANQPGVEKNANVVENILANSFLKKSPGCRACCYTPDRRIVGTSPSG